MATNEALFAAEDERMAREARGQAPTSNAALFAAQDARAAEPVMRSNISAASGTNADQFAAQRKAAQTAGMPKALGPAMPEDAQRWASVETVARDTREAPTLRHRYTDEDFARMAHDDSGPLSQIERAVGNAVRYVMGAAPGSGLPGDVASGARAVASAMPNFGAGAYGIASVPFGVADQAIQGLDNAAAWVTGTPRRQLAPGVEASLLGLSRDASATAKAVMGLSADAGLVRRGVMSGLQSGAQSLALMPLGLAGSANLMLGAMGAVTGGLSYLKGREKGLGPLQAAAFGAEDAVAEVVTERYFGAAGLLKLIKAGSSAGKLFAYEVLKEVPGEIGATLWQNFNEWQNLNPQKSVGEFIDEQPEAIAETIIATLVGGSGQIGVVKGLERAFGVAEQRRLDALRAEQAAAVMGDLAKLAEASKLRDRSPEDFQAFAQDVTANSVPALYFDARALLDSGIDLDALARTMPSVAPQAEQALATGGDIIIPSGEFLTAAPGQAFLDSLVQNARTAPEAMSAVEAKEWMAERGDALKAQVDKAMAEREADADFMAGMQVVQATIAEQLDAEPRFTKDVNQRFAALAASYYAVTAERMGTTAEKLWEKYPLTVTSKTVGDEALFSRESTRFFPPHDPAAPLARQPNTPDEIDAAKAALARIEAAGGVTSPDDLRDLLRVSGYSQWAQSPIVGDVDAAAKLRADLEARFPGPVLAVPFLNEQGVIATRERAPYDAADLKALTDIADKYGVPTIIRGPAASADELRESGPGLREAGFERYRGMQERNGRAMNEWATDQIKWIRPGGGISAVTPLFQTAYHGTPYRGITKFSTDKIGTGEGAQAYGWGLYFASKRAIAEHYREKLVANGYQLDGKGYDQYPSITESPERAIIEKFVVSTDPRGDGMSPAQAITRIQADAERALRQSEKNLKEVRENVGKTVDAGEGWGDLREFTYTADMIPEQERSVAYNKRFVAMAEALKPDSVQKNKGQLYEVEVPEDDTLLLWDKPLSEQPEKVRAALEKLDPETYSMDGGDYDANELGQMTYQRLASRLAKPEPKPSWTSISVDTDARAWSGERAASTALAAIGIKGIKYLDGGSRSAGDGSYNYVIFSGDDVAIQNALYQRDAAPRGSFDPSTNTIALLKDANLSTFLHESGHFFLSMHAELAARIQAEKTAFGQVSAGEQQLLDDVNTLLAWFGVQSSEPGRTALDEWHAMTLDEQRAHHEKFARGFEAYLFTGKAPSIQLETLFQRFRAWLTSVYKQIKALGVELTPEVRGVMDRMLATDEQIRDSEAAQSMGMIFATPEEAAKFGVDWTAYHARGEGATQDAITALGARSLRDMQWLEGAKSRELRKLQRQAATLRREAKIDARAAVMSEPVYRAWAFLTGKGDAQNRADLPEQPKPEADSLLKAIALNGGLNRDSATRDLGVHKDEYGTSSGIFGKPVFRKAGGMSADAMAETLAEAGYLALDENGKHDLAELEEKIAAELGGKLQYPIGHDYGEAPLATLPENATFGRLSTEALRERFGTGDDALWRKLSALGMTSDTVGIDPDVVGEAFGFDSGNAMVRAVAAAPPPAEAIEAATDRLMLERHGDITSPEALERASNAAIHNEARARFVANELDALSAANDAKRDAGKDRLGRKRRVAILPEAARRFAAETIARLKLRDLLPARYEAAGARAGRAAEKALRKDDIARAALEKRNQLINVHAAKAAHEAQAEVKQALRYFKRLGTDASRKRLTADYSDQIDALLAQYDLRQRSLKDTDKRIALSAWVADQKERGIEVDIDPDALATSKPFKEMTVEELRGLVDAVRQIEHLGRTKGRMLLAKGTREYKAVRDAMVAGIEANAHGRKSSARSATTNLGRAWERVKAFGAAHIKVAQLARIMDGGKDGGRVWEGLVRPANEQANLETEMRAEATQALSEVMQPVREAGRMGGKGAFFPSIGRSMNRESVFVMALNMGNEGNIQRLLGGEGWTVEQIQPVLATLTSADWRAVQRVWDFMESYRPQIAALERRVLGREPKWIDPRPLTVTGSDGVVVNLRGGYYPIVYDPKASIRAEENADAEGAKALLRGAHGAATTRRSFTKQRVESVVGRPLMYTLQGLYGGVNDVIHDLTWREWLIDTNRLLRSDKLDTAMRGTYGPEAVQQFKSWREDIAIGDRGAQSAADSAANWLRQSVSIAGLGFNVMSAAIQPLGLTSSISRIGAKWVGAGIKQYLAAPVRMTREVAERSSFMRNRQRTQFRELNELRNKIQDGPVANIKDDAAKYAYWLMMRAQQTVDVPTWLGAYEKAIAEGSDDARAVQLADQAVIDAQGAGHMHSQSALERGGALLRLFTVFYSFMNTTLNMLVMKGMTNHSAAKTAVDVLLLAAAPAVLASLLRDALTPGDAEDDDDWAAMAKKLAGEQITFLFGLVVFGREFAEAGRTAAGLADQPRDYAGPAGLRAISDAAKLAQQVNQGDADDAMRKAIVNVSGSWFGLPAAQINRTITGTKAIIEGDTKNPAAVVFGYQEPR